MMTGNSENNANGTVAQNANGEVQEGQQQPQQPARTDWYSMIKGFMIRLVIIYFISSLFRRSPTPAPGQEAAKTGGRPYSAVPAMNIFQRGALLELYAYLSESAVFKDFDNPNALFWHEKHITYGDWEAGPFADGSYAKSGQVKASENLINNGSLYLHLYLVRSGGTPNPNTTGLYSKKYTMYVSKMLTKYKSRKLSRTTNLLTGVTEGIDPGEAPANVTRLPPTTHWHPNLTIQLLDDHSPWTEGSVPPPLNDFIKFYPPTNEYYPVIYVNDYWNLAQDYMPINETTPVLNLSLTFAPISLFKWQIYAAQTMRNKWYSNILGEGVMEESDEEQDTLKKTLVETNPYLLAMTVVVSLVHSVFEFLAFKNDIQFWHSRESLEGLSVRSVFFNVFQSVIVVLYVLDNDTNFVVKVSVVIGLAIEVWKIKKVVNIRIDRENLLFGVLPRIRIDDKSSYTETDTKKYDQLAFKYLSWLLYPMLGCYAVYSLLYLEHRGWYSWVLNMLYGFLLTFGFIMMTPQLFINYKLKSVAHLPWRMLTYKALNTFIDDIFAFVIRMPTLYRLGCLRDDVIFFIYLYQRWIYPIDPGRMNEYGVSKDMLDKRHGAVVPAADETSSTGEGAVAATNEETREDKKTK